VYEREVPNPRGVGQRFTPEEQAVAIFLSHTVILLAVTVIMLVGVESTPPWLFFAGEGVIWVVFAVLVLGFDSVCQFIIRYAPEAKDGLKRIEEWKTRAPAVAFGVAFVLQYVAVTPLLTETGGPIDSPFSQLAVAFAVFTPLIANEPKTMGISLVLFLLYYAVMVWQFGGEAAVERPGAGVFYAVTALIASLSVALSVMVQRDLMREVGAGNDGGGGAQ
jgi:hypothetical protein